MRVCFSTVLFIFAFTLAASARPDSVTGRRSRQLRHSALFEKRDVLGALLATSTTKVTTTGDTKAIGTSSAARQSSVQPTSVASASTSAGEGASTAGSISTSSFASSSASLTASLDHLSNLANATSTIASSSHIPSSNPLSSTEPAITSSSTEQSKAVTTITTDSGGQASVITLVLTATASGSAAAAESSTSKKNSGSSISTGAIIGISIAAGAVLLGLIGFAIWRMKRRSGDDDEAIRWPELNRHGDADTHHALPARQTGQHGIETGHERSLSDSSDIYGGDMPQTAMSSHSHGATMALNGSAFGVASSLDEYPYDNTIMPSITGQAMQQHHSVYDHDEDYTNMPPQLLARRDSPGNIYPDHDSENGSPVMVARQVQPVTYHHNY